MFCFSKIHFFTDIRPDLLRPALWFGGWQALFDFSAAFWVLSGDGCLGGCL
jgi:hypothetical protein